MRGPAVQQFRALRFRKIKLFSRGDGVRVIKAVGGILLLFSQPHLAIRNSVGPANIENILDSLEIRGDAVQSIRDLHGNRVQIDATALLKVSELRNLQAIQRHLPADAPGAQCGRFPIVLFKLYVVLTQIDPHGLQTIEIEALDVRGRRLEYYLKLSVFIQTIRVLAVASVRGASA